MGWDNPPLPWQEFERLLSWRKPAGKPADQPEADADAPAQPQRPRLVAARDEPWDESSLDRVFDAYRVSERAFRTAFEDCNRYRRINRLVLPSMLKLSLEVRAMAHRRRGTWA